MRTVVTWWQGETRRSYTLPTREQAEGYARVVRQQSDRAAGESYIPIRVLAEAVYKRMQALAAEHDARGCKHTSTRRLCERCVEADLMEEAKKGHGSQEKGTRYVL